MRGGTMRAFRIVVAVTVAAMAVGACGGNEKKASPQDSTRPLTPARVQILSPTPNQETGPDITVELQLIGAKEVQPVEGEIRPDEGHIHVSLDGVVVAMAYGTTQTLKGLLPGQHSVQAEFVAIDH